MGWWHCVHTIRLSHFNTPSFLSSFFFLFSSLFSVKSNPTPFLLSIVLSSLNYLPFLLLWRSCFSSLLSFFHLSFLPIFIYSFPPIFIYSFLPSFRFVFLLSFFPSTYFSCIPSLLPSNTFLVFSYSYPYNRQITYTFKHTSTHTRTYLAILMTDSLGRGSPNLALSIKSITYPEKKK